MLKVIEVFSANTPNGKKIGIMLEEVGFENSRAKLIFPGMATIWQAEKPLGKN